MIKKIFASLLFCAFCMPVVHSSASSDVDGMKQVMHEINAYPCKSSTLDAIIIPNAIEHAANHIVERHFGINKNWHLYIDNPGKKDEKVFVRSAFVFSDETFSKFPDIGAAVVNSAAYATCKFEEAALSKLITKKPGEKGELEKILGKLNSIAAESLTDLRKSISILKNIQDILLSCCLIKTFVNKAIDIVGPISSIDGTEPNNRMKSYENMLENSKKAYEMCTDLIEIITARFRILDSDKDIITIRGIVAGKIDEIKAHVIALEEGVVDASQSFANKENAADVSAITEGSDTYEFLMQIGKKIVQHVMKNANTPIYTSESKGVFFKIPTDIDSSPVELFSGLKNAFLATADIPVKETESRVPASHIFLAIDLSHGISFDTCYPVSQFQYNQMMSQTVNSGESKKKENSEKKSKKAKSISETSQGKTTVFIGGNQGVHEIDTELDTTDAVPNLITRVKCKYFLGEIPAISQDEFIGLFKAVQENMQDIVNNVYTTLVANSDVLYLTKAFIDVLYRTEAFIPLLPNYQKLTALFEKVSCGVKEQEIKQYIRTNLNDIIQITVCLLYSHIQKGIGTVWREHLVNLTNLAAVLVQNRTFVTPYLLLMALLDNVTMGGGCGAGYRNRLYTAIHTLIN